METGIAIGGVEDSSSRRVKSEIILNGRIIWKTSFLLDFGTNEFVGNFFEAVQFTDLKVTLSNLIGGHSVINEQNINNFPKNTIH